jgi:hypothetical protein
MERRRMFGRDRNRSAIVTLGGVEVVLLVGVDASLHE